jgi:hypothetical protein
MVLATGTQSDLDSNLALPHAAAGLKQALSLSESWFPPGTAGVMMEAGSPCA